MDGKGGGGGERKRSRKIGGDKGNVDCAIPPQVYLPSVCLPQCHSELQVCTHLKVVRLEGRVGTVCSQERKLCGWKWKGQVSQPAVVTLCSGGPGGEMVVTAAFFEAKLSLIPPSATSCLVVELVDVWR